MEHLELFERIEEISTKKGVGTHEKLEQCWNVIREHKEDGSMNPNILQEIQEFILALNPALYKLFVQYKNL